MGKHSIEVPDPVIVAEPFYPGDFDSDEIGVWVEVGGVKVMERVYTRGVNADFSRPENYVYDSEDAQERALAEFGEAIKTLLERGGLT